MASSKVINKLIPWVEKYRPKSLKDVASQTYTIESLQKFVERGTMPHMIFTGPAGTGKTSAAISLINDLIGRDKITQDMILERNASDECRMENLPDIKNFVNYGGLNKIDYKFVILDESDNLSREVQSAFRRVIEMAPPNVKFIFMCNYVERIIGPILSRCAIFRFYPLPKLDFVKQIKKVAKLENIKITKDMVDAIYYISQGDMRKAINLLQIIVAYVEDDKGNIQYEKINTDIIYTISGYIPKGDLDDIYKSLTKLELIKSIEKVHEMKGISSRAFFRQIMDKIIESAKEFPKLEKVLISIAEYDYRLTLEADPTIQIDGLLAELITELGEED